MTDYKEWFQAIEVDSYEEVYCLYKTIQEVEDWGAFNISNREVIDGEQFFIKTEYLDETLVLTDKSRKSFMDYLERTYCEGMDIEAWYSVNRANDKND